MFHYERAPLKLVRASGCYVYDQVGEAYLDCVSSMAPLGHGRTEIVKVMTTQMAKLGSCPPETFKAPIW